MTKEEAMTNLNHHVRLLLTVTASVLLAAACGTGSNEGSASTTTSTRTPNTVPTTSEASNGTSPSSSTPESGKALTVTVTGKRVDPAPGTITLKVGETLRLTVTSDHDDELHAHGFDKEAQLKAGQPVTLDLSTTQPGTYEVETHHPELRLLKIAVR